MIYFTAHTFKCVCHCRRAMFGVLGMYNFAIMVPFLILVNASKIVAKSLCRASVFSLFLVQVLVKISININLL